MYKKIFFVILFTIYSLNTFAIDKNIPVNNDQWRKAWETLNWIDAPKKVNYSAAQSKICLRVALTSSVLVFVIV